MWPLPFLALLLHRLPADGNVMKIELLREGHMELAQAVPCPVWNVVVSSPVLHEPRGAHPSVESMEPHGAFMGKDAANAQAREVFDGLKALAGRGAIPKQEVKDGERLADL